MAYDEGLAQRIRELVQHKPNIVEKKMFGGIAFMAYDYMFVGVVKNDLMARVGLANHSAALAKPHVIPMEFTGKSMTGYVFVQPLGLAEDEQLQHWIDMCYDFVRALPVKPLKILSNNAVRHERKDSRLNC